MQNNAAQRACCLARTIRQCLFENQADTNSAFLVALQLAQYLAESVLKKNEVALNAIAIAKDLVLKETNSSDRMSVMAASELQGVSIIEDRLALSVINFAITKSAKDCPIDEENYMAKIKMGIELLIGNQPSIDWERKITGQIQKIARCH